jgi:serine/threonine protein kinase
MAVSIAPEQILHQIRAEQQASWGSGTRTPIEVYLQRHPEVCANRELLIDLVYSEIALCRQRGETVDPNDYVRRFPDLADDLRREFEFDGYLDDILPQSPDGSTLPFQEKIPLRLLSAGSLPRIEGYDVLGHLESGSFGDVYRARDHALNRLVALKVLKRGGRIEEANFKREARMVASLNKPECFVQIFDFDESQGQQYFAMELMEGGTLKDFAKLRPLSPVEIAGLMEKVARALQAAHELGIVHRDLKPSNILLTRDGVPKIADFGLAKQLDCESTITPDSGAALGTIAFMAPEQAGGKGGEVGPRADLYALGGILYFLLCDRSPLSFEKNEPSAFALQRILHEIPAPPRRLLPDGKTPRDRSPRETDLETICLKCLEKNPADRYASAGEVADRLKRVCDGLPIPERPPGVARRLATLLRRRSGSAFTAAAVLAVTALSAAVVALLPPRQPPSETELRTKERARITDELRTGGRYVFDKNAPMPGPLAWRIGGERTFKKSPHLSFDSPEISLLELTSDPGVEGWRLSAKVRHKSASGDSAVGFYFSSHRLSGDDEPLVESFFLLGFDDRGTTAWRRKTALGLTGNAFLMSRLHREAYAFGLGGVSPMYGYLPIKAVLSENPPSPLRELRLEVTPATVQGFCTEDDDLQPVGGPFPVEAITRPIAIHYPENQPAVRPPYSPRASIGLFVLRGEADFDEITLERLDP